MHLYTYWGTYVPYTRLWLVYIIVLIIVITTYSKILWGKHLLLIMVKLAYCNTLEAKDAALYLNIGETL